ncbi:MAG: copper chaperone PCu(A)C [Woeseiaceae bacterium]
MKLLTISILFNLLISLNAFATSTDSLQFINAHIPEAPPNASVMAGYMEIHNPTDKNIDIIAIDSSSFNSIEMHQSKEIDGFAKMLPQKKLSIPAKGKLILTAGSYHLMLIKPVKWFNHGEQITLNFSLSNSSKISINIGVKKSASPSMKCATGKCGSM